MHIDLPIRLSQYTKHLRSNTSNDPILMRLNTRRKKNLFANYLFIGRMHAYCNILKHLVFWIMQILFSMWSILKPLYSINEHDWSSSLILFFFYLWQNNADRRALLPSQFCTFPVDKTNWNLINGRKATNLAAVATKTKAKISEK